MTAGKIINNYTNVLLLLTAKLSLIAGFSETMHSYIHCTQQHSFTARAVPNSRFVLTLTPNCGSNSLFVLSWIVCPDQTAESYANSLLHNTHYRRQREWILQKCDLFRHRHTRLKALFRDYPGKPVPERKNQSGLYWSKRQWVAVASAGPYASLHLAPDR